MKIEGKFIFKVAGTLTAISLVVALLLGRSYGWLWADPLMGVIGALVIIVNVISDILGAMANPLKHKEWYALR